MKVLQKSAKGTDVMEVQSLLEKMGYNPGAIDGIYGNNTENAVKHFQEVNKLPQTGIIDTNTGRILESFLLGYDTYTIKTDDNLYTIAKKYYTDISRIITANPGISPYNLTVGRKIIVPYNIDIVDTRIDYTYEIMEKNIKGLKARYPFITIGSIGKSVLGKNLYFIKIGNGPNEVFYNGAHHSLEWITSSLLMKFIENFCKSYSQNRNIKGYSITQIWNQSSIYIVPMVNPDGIDLVLNGLSKGNPFYDDLIKWNNGSTDFSKNWQANIRGVDLNHNYDASWELSKEAEPSYGVYGPGPTRYSGPYQVSEPETRAMVEFTRNHFFRLVLAYHSQGEVIYWQYSSVTPPESKKIAEIFSDVTGYLLSETTGIDSYSGYKDWFIQEFLRPGFTIEVGKGTNPLPISQFNKIYNDNKELLILASII